MGSVERREREREGVRQRMLDAARRLFAAEGYAAVSMRRIADAIEYSPTAIYSHFADKHALIHELVTADFAALNEAAGSAVAVADPVERLRQLGRVYVRFAVGHPNHYKLMFMTELPAADVAAQPPLPCEGKGNPDLDAYALLLHTTAEAIAAGRLRLTDADLAAQTFWAAVHGVASLHIVKADNPWITLAPLEHRIAAAVDGMLDGLLVPPTPFSGGPQGRASSAGPARPDGLPPKGVAIQTEDRP